MKRQRRLWAVLCLCHNNALPWVLNAVGTDNRWQYPIFPSREEARGWAKSKPWRTRVVSCVVTFDNGSPY